MPQGDKSKYTDKQKRKAEHIADSYEDRGVDPDEAESRAWATVNKDDGGGNRAGRAAAPYRQSRREEGREGRRGGRSRPPGRERSESAKKAAETRRRNAQRE